MGSFSGAVKIGDVNDFITPAQACVLNLDGSKAEGTKVQPFNDLVDSMLAFCSFASA